MPKGKPHPRLSSSDDDEDDTTPLCELGVKFRNSFRSLCAVSWCCLDTVVGPGPSGLGPPKARHVAWRKHCSAIGLPGSTVAVDKSAVGRWIRRAPMQPKSIGLRSLTSLDLIDLGRSME